LYLIRAIQSARNIAQNLNAARPAKRQARGGGCQNRGTKATSGGRKTSSVFSGGERTIRATGAEIAKKGKLRYKIP